MPLIERIVFGCPFGYLAHEAHAHTVAQCVRFWHCTLYETALIKTDTQKGNTFGILRPVLNHTSGKRTGSCRYGRKDGSSYNPTLSGHPQNCGACNSTYAARLATDCTNVSLCTHNTYTLEPACANPPSDCGSAKMGSVRCQLLLSNATLCTMVSRASTCSTGRTHTQ